MVLGVRVEPEGFATTRLVESRGLTRSYSPPSLVDDVLYGFTGRFLSAVDSTSGELLWRSRAPGDGFLVALGDRLVVLTKKGTLHLGAADPSGWVEEDRLELFSDLAWSPPSAAGRSLFVRSLGQIARVDLVEGGTAQVAPAFEPPPLLRALADEIAAAGGDQKARGEAVDRFLDGRELPWIDGRDVLFLWRGEAEDVAIAGDMIGIRREEVMHRLPGTDLWWWQTRLDRRSRVGYLFFVDKEPTVDPRHLRRAPSTILGPDLDWQRDVPLEMGRSPRDVGARHAGLARPASIESGTARRNRSPPVDFSGSGLVRSPLPALAAARLPRQRPALSGGLRAPSTGPRARSATGTIPTTTARRKNTSTTPTPRELTQDYPSAFALDNRSLPLTVEWQTPWGFTATSLTGWQKLEKEQTLDGDRLTTDLVSTNLTGFFPANFDLLLYWDNDSEAISQEFNLTSAGDRLDWVLGAYYLEHENFNDFLEAVGPGSPSDFQEQLDNPSPETLPPFQAPLEFVETRTLTREDTAVYGQLTYRFSDRAAFTLGGRYQRDEATDVSTQFWFIDSEQVLKDDVFTWKAGLDLNLGDGHLLYGLISTGWKNGGNSPGALNGALDVAPTFEPEEVTALEIGSKNMPASGQARLNAAAFYYDYENYQFIQEDPVPFAGGTGNIPSLEIYGLETEFSWLINDRWRLDGQFSLADGDIKSNLFVLDTVDFLNSGFGRFTPTGVADRASLRRNLNGNSPPERVEESLRLALGYNRPLADGHLFSSGLEYIHRGEFQYRVFNNPEVDTVPAYDVAHLFFELDLGHIPLSFAVNMSNLFDEDGVNSRFSNPYGLHTTSEELIPPRQLIGRVSYRF